MIDFSKYTLQELQAITDALDTLTDDIVERDLSVGWVFREYRNAREAVEKKIAQQARDHEAAEAEKVDRIKQACVAGAPPAIQCSNIDKCGVCLAECPFIDDHEPAPDMFGWVGDALDGLKV